MFLFCEAKAKTARRGRKIFPSGKIFVTKNTIIFSNLWPQSGTKDLVTCDQKIPAIRMGGNGVWTICIIEQYCLKKQFPLY